MSQPHPSQAELRDFAIGRLPEPVALEVEGHLSECDNCRTVVEQAPRDTLVDLLRRKDSPSIAGTEAWSGMGGETGGGRRETVVVGDIPEALAAHPRYRVLGVAGSGGMGAVYKAEHIVMQRVVALKTIRPGLLDNRAMVERFQREVAAAARLSHPNVVAAYDAEYVAGMHFLVMEFVEGRTLAEVVAKQGPLDVARACQYVRQAALGLEHAYQRGMVHRDIKPHNLMLTPEGTVKVLDFGLARLEQEAQADGAADNAAPSDSQLTRAGTVMGTPDFMAPEQASEASQADIRADIFSLGCTLFYLLSGRKPFAGGSSDPGALAGRRTRRLSEVTSNVPRQLAAVVEKMMAASPSARYASPAEVARALEPFALPGKRSARRLAIVAVAALLLVAATAASLWRASGRTLPFAAPSGDQLAARWVLQSGGSVALQQNGNDLPVISDVADLPGGRFQLKRVTFNGRTAEFGAGLATLCRSESLVEFDARDSSFCDADAGSLRALHSLPILRINKTRLTDAGMQAIGAMAAMERLDISSNPITDVGLARLAPLKKLKDLQLNYTEIDDAGLEWLPALAELEALYLSGTKITDAGLAALVRLPKLTRLHLVNCKITDRGLVHLSRLPQLAVLYLSETPVTDAGLTQLYGMTQLKFLDLQRSRVSSAGVFALRVALPHCHVKDLIGGEGREPPMTADEIKANRDAAQWAVALGAKLLLADGDGEPLELESQQPLPDGPVRIRELDLTHCNLKDAGCAHLLGLSSLRRLTLDGTAIHGEALASLAGLEQLSELRLNYMNLGPVGLKQLPPLPQLAVLYASGSSVDDSDFVDFERFPSLRGVYVSGTAVTERILDHLPRQKIVALALGNTKISAAATAQFGQFPRLTYLHLDGTKVTDDALVGLQAIGRLTMLDLRKTPVSNAGLSHLEKLTALRTLRLSGTKVTAAGVARLRRMLPGCLIEWDATAPGAGKAQDAADRRAGGDVDREPSGI